MAEEVRPGQVPLLPGTTVPAVHPDWVVRESLVSRLDAEGETPVLLVVAGAGYGKTTLLTQWANQSGRSFAWLSIRARHNDPRVFLADLARALESVSPEDAAVLADLAGSARDLTTMLLPVLGDALARLPQSVVIVLDDAHVLVSRSALALLHVLVDRTPGRGPQVVLAARREPALALSRLRTDRRLSAFDTGDLAMSPVEALALASRAGAELEPSACDLLVERTEGWPTGLYLAALRLRDETDPSAAAEEFVGSDRDVGRYFRDEVLRSLAPRTVDFLTRTSILEQLSGPLCDAVLRVSGSAGLLEDLHRSILFIVAVDRDQEWYQCHLLFREVLEAEFRKQDPRLKTVLHGRASQWFEEYDNVDAAVHHAQMTGDEERADGLIYAAAPGLLLRGQTETVERWLDPYTAEQIASRPALIVTSAWKATSAGEMAGFKHWASVAELAPQNATLPDGASLSTAVALLRAGIGVDGLEAMRRDAALAFEHEREDSAFRALACWLEGCALRLLGETELARTMLEKGVTIGRLRAPAMQAQCLAQLAAIAIDGDEWEVAGALVDEALGIVDDHRLGERPAMTMVYGVAALVHAQQGKPNGALVESKHASKLLEQLTDVGPWAVAEARRLLAATALRLGDVRAAGELLKQARATLAKVPDSDALAKRLDELAERIDVSAAPLGTAAAPLTPAEMRLLRLLATHLNQKEIAAELFVSPNTVKTQAVSIYRKLGVSGRTPAVNAARALGILEA